jgi:hypothetical protein
MYVHIDEPRQTGRILEADDLSTFLVNEALCDGLNRAFGNFDGVLAKNISAGSDK